MQQVAKKELPPDEIYQSIGKLQLVNITLDRGADDPQAIFESLNSTGIDLTDSDLIRNHILMGLDAAGQLNVYNTLWRPMESLFDYVHQSELMDNFFRDYLTMKLGRIPRKKEVYKEFKGYRANCRMTVPDLCKDVYGFAKHYANMYFGKNDDPVLKSLYGDMKAIRMEVAYPFLLKIHDDCDKGLLTIDDLREIVRLCVSYVLRRAVCDIPTNSLNKTFAMMKNGIHDDDYLNSVKAFFIQLDSYKEFPSEEKFLAAFISRDIYHMNRCGYILERLENWDNKAPVLLDNLTIEHIIPQNPHLSKNWIAALGDNWSEVQKKYLHTIGNLTLTAYNAEMSDSPFEDKLNMRGGFKQSALRINTYVVAQPVWGEKQITVRAKKLGETARQIWPFPALGDDQLAPYLKPDTSAGHYSLESYGQLNPSNKALFESLDARIMKLDSFIKREFKKLYIAYKLDTNFVDVVIQKACLRLSVNMKYADVIDPKGICGDITDKGRWGNGDVEVFLESRDQLDDVMFIIEQGLREQLGGNIEGSGKLF